MGRTSKAQNNMLNRKCENIKQNCVQKIRKATVKTAFRVHSNPHITIKITKNSYATNWTIKRF